MEAQGVTRVFSFQRELSFLPTGGPSSCGSKILGLSAWCEVGPNLKENLTVYLVHWFIHETAPHIIYQYDTPAHSQDVSIINLDLPGFHEL